MENVAHDPSFARMHKIPQDVGQHHLMSDKRDHYGSHFNRSYAKGMKRAGDKLKNKQVIHMGKGVNDFLSAKYRVL